MGDLLKQIQLLNEVLGKFDSRLRVIEGNSTNIALSLWFFNNLLIIILIMTGLHLLIYLIRVGVEYCTIEKRKTEEPQSEEST